MYYFPCAPLVQRDAESRMSRLARHCAVAGGHDCGSARAENYRGTVGRVGDVGPGTGMAVLVARIGSVRSRASGCLQQIRDCSARLCGSVWKSTPRSATCKKIK